MDYCPSVVRGKVVASFFGPRFFQVNSKKKRNTSQRRHASMEFCDPHVLNWAFSILSWLTGILSITRQPTVLCQLLQPFFQLFGASPESTTRSKPIKIVVFQTKFWALTNIPYMYITPRYEWISEKLTTCSLGVSSVLANLVRHQRPRQIPCSTYLQGSERETFVSYVSYIWVIFFFNSKPDL